MARKKTSGLGSEAAVKRALDRKFEIERELEKLRAQLAKSKTAQRIEELGAEVMQIDSDVKTFVLLNYGAGDGYEDDRVKITKVVGHTRIWNADKLQKLVPGRIFKTLVKVVVDAAAVDEAVKAGKLDLDRIEAAFEERPNNPYTKITPKSPNAAESAQSLAEKLA